MVTFKICVFKHQKREDGNYPVSIRVTWKRKQVYIKTEYYASPKQITKDFELKDTFIIRELNDRIAKYEDLKIHKLKQSIEQYSAKERAEYFVKHSKNDTDVRLDFIMFSEDFARNTINKRTASLYTTVINSLNNFTGDNRLFVNDITTAFLNNYEDGCLPTCLPVSH